MKKRHLLCFATVIFLAGGLAQPIAAAVVHPDPARLHSPAVEQNVRCGGSTPANADMCRAIEEAILKSTVRFRIDTWAVLEGDSGFEIDVSIGHGTLKDGRFLVTHNHFGVPLSIRTRQGEPEAYGVITFYEAGGEAVFQGPLSEFELVWEGPETLVIASKDASLFQGLGFVSAEFRDWTAAPLGPGMEVAQVDWDGALTRVDWTIVHEISVTEGTPRLVLADDARNGASGGGIFWQGIHIGNNWTRVEQYASSGTLLGSVTKVALNSPRVAEGFMAQTEK